jgi:hypothetical protein
MVAGAWSRRGSSRTSCSLAAHRTKQNKTEETVVSACCEKKPSAVPRNQCTVIRARGCTCPFGGYEYDAAAFTVLAELCTIVLYSYLYRSACTDHATASRHDVY